MRANELDYILTTMLDSNKDVSDLILTVDKLRQKAECTLHVRGKDLHCESEEEDLYAAIDLMVDKLDRQVLKHKEQEIMQV